MKAKIRAEEIMKAETLVEEVMKADIHAEGAMIVDIRAEVATKADIRAEVATIGDIQVELNMIADILAEEVMKVDIHAEVAMIAVIQAEEAMMAGIQAEEAIIADIQAEEVMKVDIHAEVGTVADIQDEMLMRAAKSLHIKAEIPTRTNNPSKINRMPEENSRYYRVPVEEAEEDTNHRLQAHKMTVSMGNHLMEQPHLVNKRSKPALGFPYRQVVAEEVAEVPLEVEMTSVQINSNGNTKSLKVMMKQCSE
jgi:hypothetical protein